MKKNGLMKKAMNSFMGRVLRRLAGEEKGAVMMEYIVIALLIAAAAIVAVSFFGSTTSKMFGVMTRFLSNNVDSAVEEWQEIRDEVPTIDDGNQTLHVEGNVNGQNNVNVR